MRYSMMEDQHPATIRGKGGKSKRRIARLSSVSSLATVVAAAMLPVGSIRGGAHAFAPPPGTPAAAASTPPRSVVVPPAFWGGGCRGGFRPLFSSSEEPTTDDQPTAERNVADLDPHEYFADKNDFTVDAEDSNTWVSADETYDKFEKDDDWEETMARRTDGSMWSSFDSSAAGGEEGKDEESDDDRTAKANVAAEHEMADDGEAAWLDTLASITAEEIEFNLQEADRADKVRQMQEWGFNSESISSTLGVATDELLEKVQDNEMFEQFKEVTAESGFGLYLGDDVDLSEVESHTTVDIDEDSGEPIRSQMVYVDEHTCIGCTNCAMIAQSTFFMHEEHGRARVFEQWGDDDETIQVAIETCPVDCIHYVPYDELVRLEVERRDQNINFKARLVNQGEYGGSVSHRVGGASIFTAPQKISGNMASRCNNCPSRGCKNCPMYGIGENPEFKRKEAIRKEKRARRLLQEKMESENKSVDL